MACHHAATVCCLAQADADAGRWVAKPSQNQSPKANALSQPNERQEPVEAQRIVSIASR